MFDLVIKNGRIFDGSGNPWFHGDVGITGDTIAQVGVGLEGEKTIDAGGLAVSPGFIDIHSHSDIPLLVDPRAQSKIRQGVTTEVVGQCGNSAAPMNEKVRAYRDTYSRSLVPEDFQFDWDTMDSYMRKLESQGVAVNVAPVVGHGTVRQNVMGFDNREPTQDELEEMKSLVRQALEEGAWGMSTGLIYPPSVYGKTPEIIELCKVVSEYNATYFTHIRGEAETLLEAVEEACTIGREAAVRVQIAHFKASGPANWGKTKESLALVEKFRSLGVDVTFDQYPYIASSTNLTALLPHWSMEGGAEQLLKHLQDPEARAKMAQELRLNYGWDKIMVAKAKNNPQFNGKTIQEIAQEMGKEPLDAVFELLLQEEAQVPSVMFGMNEEDVRRVMKSPHGMVGSDGSAICPEGVWRDFVPHPRYYGTFPRVLGHYARDEKIIPLQEAVRKMTWAPARKVGLKDRGLIHPGFKADLVVFNPETVKDKATFQNPHQYPQGIHYVLVNGEIVVQNGEHTGRLPGKVLRRN